MSNGFRAPRIIGQGQIQRPHLVDPIGGIADDIHEYAKEKEDKRRYEQDYDLKKDVYNKTFSGQAKDRARQKKVQDALINEKFWRMWKDGKPVYREGMRDPNDPTQTLGPDHDLVKNGRLIPFDDWIETNSSYNQYFSTHQKEVNKQDFFNYNQQLKNSTETYISDPFTGEYTITNFGAKLEEENRERLRLQEEAAAALEANPNMLDLIKDKMKDNTYIPEIQDTGTDRYSTTESKFPDVNKIDLNVKDYPELKNFKQGNYVPGKRTGDKNPAMLEDGEYVLNRNAVDALGKGFLDHINNDKYPRFQSGGFANPGTTGQGGQIAGPTILEETAFDVLAKGLSSMAGSDTGVPDPGVSAAAMDPNVSGSFAQRANEFTAPPQSTVFNANEPFQSRFNFQAGGFIDHMQAGGSSDRLQYKSYTKPEMQFERDFYQGRADEDAVHAYLRHQRAEQEKFEFYQQQKHELESAPGRWAVPNKRNQFLNPLTWTLGLFDKGILTTEQDLLENLDRGYEESKYNKKQFFKQYDDPTEDYQMSPQIYEALSKDRGWVEGQSDSDLIKMLDRTYTGPYTKDKGRW